MRPRIQRLCRDERGMSFIYVAMGFVSFLAASTLAIDVGMFMTARAQTQNAADAGALSGAIALVKNDWDDRSASGPAVQSAMNTARANKVIGGTPTVQPADVTFPVGPAGLSNRVQVFAHRPELPTILGKLFGVNTVNLNAVAVAEVTPANAATCVKPWTIPDKWKEVDSGKPWTPDSTFDIYDNKGKPLPKPDVYIGPEDKDNYTGYNPVRDKGLRLVLKASNESKITASWYNAWRLPGSFGANDYREAISGCNTAVIDMNKIYAPETGNMVGPTDQGTKDLIAKDPKALWDDGCNCVKDSEYGERSPRIVIIPVYHPVVYANGPQHGNNIQLKFVNFLGFFIEPMKGGEVIGRLTPVAGLLSPTGDPAPVGAFPYVIRLVQ